VPASTSEVEEAQVGGFVLQPYLPYLLGALALTLAGELIKLAIIALALRKAGPKDRPAILRSLAPLLSRRIEFRLPGDRRGRSETDP
jgi:hypothetical protein